MKHNNPTKFESVGAGSVRRAQDASRATERVITIWFGIGIGIGAVLGAVLAVGLMGLAMVMP
jgi:hypothetical protein